jgi:hypothetical protein
VSEGDAEPRQYPTVYVETTVISYLAADPSGDPGLAVCRS